MATLTVATYGASAFRMMCLAVLQGRDSAGVPTSDGGRVVVSIVPDEVTGDDFVGVVVTRYSPPVAGPFGGSLLDEATESLWGVERDSGEYILTIAGDLAADLECFAAAR